MTPPSYRNARDKPCLCLAGSGRQAALRRRQPGLRPAGLSAREAEVAAAVARGLTDKQIARELGLAPSSVRTYLNRLFEKTGERRRAGLARWAAARLAPDAQRAGAGSGPNSD